MNSSPPLTAVQCRASSLHITNCRPQETLAVLRWLGGGMGCGVLAEAGAPHGQANIKLARQQKCKRRLCLPPNVCELDVLQFGKKNP